jgi:hypothetical protein
MADERTQAPYNQKSPVPSMYSWPPSPQPSPRGRGRFVCGGDELFDHYRHTLEALGNQKGLLGLIFNKPQNKFDSDHPWSSAFGRAARAQICSQRICQDPAKRRRLMLGFQLAAYKGFNQPYPFRWNRVATAGWIGPWS